MSCKAPEQGCEVIFHNSTESSDWSVRSRLSPFDGGHETKLCRIDNYVLYFVAKSSIFQLAGLKQKIDFRSDSGDSHDSLLTRMC